MFSDSCVREGSLILLSASKQLCLVKGGGIRKMLKYLEMFTELPTRKLVCAELHLLLTCFEFTVLWSKVLQMSC